MTMKQKVAIFGGSFDPITYAHLNIITEVLASEVVDAIWVVPTGPSRKDKNTQTSFNDRYNMCTIALQEYLPLNILSRVEIKDFERNQFVPTTEHLRQFKNDPNIELCLIIGADLLTTLHKWINAQELINGCHLLVLNRQPSLSTPRGANYQQHEENEGQCTCDTINWLPVDKSQRPKKWTCIHCKLMNIHGWEMIRTSLSSTEARTRLHKYWQQQQTPYCQAAVLSTLCPAVLQYITKHNLYQD